MRRFLLGYAFGVIVGSIASKVIIETQLYINYLENRR